MTQVGVRKLVSHDQGELRICARNPQDTGMDDYPVAGRKGVRRGIGYQVDGDDAGRHWSHRAEFVNAIASDQNLNWALAIVAHKIRDQPAVQERGTASLLNVRRWSPGFILAMAAGEVSATDSTDACVQLTESAS